MLRSFCRSLRSTATVTSRRMYHPNVVDHYENPRNVGSLDDKDENVGTGLVGAPACGDVMKLQIKIDGEGNIEEAKFKTFGCGSAIASSSYATEWLKGKKVDEAAKLENSEIASHLNLPPVKLHCSMLAQDAVKAAIKNYKEKKGLESESS
mmetsp:Transcript_19146/g.30449  ORF Transcript_19146/g.30449 Transcript_19146/m.30449 type:complete len:151 (-) Transcript_19146:280-732(-)|eukprot:jgi/Bigna1/53822/estExt_Genewise1Plus.C_240140